MVSEFSDKVSRKSVNCRKGNHLTEYSSNSERKVKWNRNSWYISEDFGIPPEIQENEAGVWYWGWKMEFTTCIPHFRTLCIIIVLTSVVQKSQGKLMQIKPFDEENWKLKKTRIMCKNVSFAKPTWGLWCFQKFEKKNFLEVGAFPQHHPFERPGWKEILRPM